MDAKAYLYNKFRSVLPQLSPIRCSGMERRNLAIIFNTLGYKKGAEIGVAGGIFSEILCKAIDGLNLTCVDSYQPNLYASKEKIDRCNDIALNRLKPYDVYFVIETSMEAVRDVPDESLDFVYIDANHEFDYVMQDIIEWSKKVRVGGIVSGHDYYRFPHGGVVTAVDTYTYVHQIHEWFVTDEITPSWFWVREEENDKLSV